VRRGAAVLRPLLYVALFTGSALLAGCTARQDASGASGAEPSGVVPATEVAALHATVDAINAAAQTPEQQREVLDRLAADQYATEQSRCAPATTTVTLEPAWSRLRTLPGEPVRYALPTLLRVHGDGRITGTDLTVLVMQVVDGHGRTSALCVA